MKSAGCWFKSSMVGFSAAFSERRTDSRLYLPLRSRQLFSRAVRGHQEEKMIRSLILAGAIAVIAGTAHAEEPIVGKWKTASGETAVIAACGGSYCVTLKTGKYTGRKIGTLAGTGGSYAGEITDPAADKTYSGSGKISGNSLKMQGCVMNILCKTQTWTRL
jgi:uncharacterized protein (DUF2147 family)